VREGHSRGACDEGFGQVREPLQDVLVQGAQVVHAGADADGELAAHGHHGPDPVGAFTGERQRGFAVFAGLGKSGGAHPLFGLRSCRDGLQAYAYFLDNGAGPVLGDRLPPP
jgi:hypothetical protein